MNDSELLSRMIPPGRTRPNVWRNGTIQIWITRACDNSCYGCTQGSNLAGKPEFMTVEQFDAACKSLAGYWGVVGVFGGNPALHPQFEKICSILSSHFPREQRGLWCNHPRGHGKVMRDTFDPAVSNLNVHLNREAFDEFTRDWPESKPFGLDIDSRHSPVFVAMKDLIADENTRRSLIADCDINKYWSAMIGVFRGSLRGWFCEIAGSQSMLHQHDPSYPDTGFPIRSDGITVVYINDGKWMHAHWWTLPMSEFARQVRKHCHECGIPLKGFGELAITGDGVEQTTATHEAIFRPKRVGRKVEVLTKLVQLGSPLRRMTDYITNGSPRSSS